MLVGIVKAMGDALVTFDAHDLISAFLARRFIIPLAISILIGIGVYYLGGQTRAGAAVAFAIVIVGFCIGVVFHFADGKSGLS